MPSLKDIRRRIGSVKSTQKITRAMKLVAAAKLRRAQDNILAARPYAVKLHEMISELALRADAGDHPLLAVREPRRVMLVVLTSDRGLCGAFNTNTLRATERYRREHATTHEEILLSVVGRKGRDYLKYRNVDVHQYFPGVDVNTALDRARTISDGIIDEFLKSNLDMVYLLYNEFKSAMQQRITVEQLLPIVPMQLPEGHAAPVDFLYEPNKVELLETIMPMYVSVEVYRATLETTASEYGARMTAMENATNNASDMIGSLTLQYNKARQASITKELLEIVAGAEALKR
ncbi:MAG: ATP synthase F1 subunit gamma [Deltaproteobacteria bacterium]|nr:ATP synthase F1 subunit gamma [Deltaproteobacteria bacterium]